MRINTEGKYAYRRDVIEQAADYYDCNRTDAIVAACDDVTGLVSAVQSILSRSDLTEEQRGEMIETVNNETRAVKFDSETSVTFEKDP